MKKLITILFVLFSLTGFGQSLHNLPGIGANPGNVAEHYGRVFNVKDYKAKGDGSTDDTAPIQAAIQACHDAGGGTVWFPYGLYIINGSIQTSVGGKNMNAQLYGPFDGTVTNFVTIVFEGEGSPSPGNLIMTPFTPVALGTKGVFLYSTYTGTGSTTTLGTAIIGTASGNGNCFYFKNMGFLAKNNPNGAGPEIGGVNMKYANGASFYNCTYGIDTGGANFVLPIRDISGFETPDNGLGATYNVYNCSSYGVKWGFLFSEHVSGDQVTASECYNGIGFKAGTHASHLGRANSFWCVNAIAYHATGSYNFGPMVISIDELDLEFGVGNTGKFYNSVEGVVDTLNRLVGTVYFSSVTQNSVHDNTTFIKNGGTGLSCIGIGDAGTGNPWTISGSDANTTLRVVIPQFVHKNGLQMGSLGLQDNTTSATTISNNEYSDSGGSGGFKYVVTAPASFFQMGGGGIFTYSAPSGTANTVMTATVTGGVILNGNHIIGSDVSDRGAWLQIPKNTATNAGIRLTPSNVAVTTPTNGMLWYDSLHDVLNFQHGGTLTNILSGGGGGTPGGSTTDVQINDAGSFYGDGNFIYDKTAKKLSLPTNTTTGPGLVVGGLQVEGFAADNLIFGNNILYNSGFKYVTSAAGEVINMGSGQINFDVFASGISGAAATTITPLYLDNTGIVKIGNVPGSSVWNLNVNPNSFTFATTCVPSGTTTDSVLVFTNSAGVSTLKAVAQSSLGGGMTNPLTTTGDIIYSSSGTTPARLGIGATNAVLTVASGIPAWGPILQGGTWASSPANTTNISASSETNVNYHRIGNTVFCSVGYGVTPTSGSNAQTVLTINLPFATSTTTQGAVGTGTWSDNAGASVYTGAEVEVVSGTTAKIHFQAATTNAGILTAHFAYHIN